jgi:1,4-alpha-glucan branching enzyme/maltooligosyltrehalose trehalohydrolase
MSRLDWGVVAEPVHQEWLNLYRKLLTLRCQHIVPLLSGACGVKANYDARSSKLTAEWNFSGAKLTLLANLGVDSLSEISLPDSPIIYASEEIHGNESKQGTLPAWSVFWFLRS